MNLKVLKFSFFVFLICFFLVPGVSAQEKKQVVLVNPIRGPDFWVHNFSLTETPKKQYEIIKKNNFPATWLVRYDGLANPEISDFLKSLDNSQDIGIFFEITPTLTNAAGVKYNQSDNWHSAKSVLLTGYSPEDRVKLINTALKKYKEIFAKFPKSVGAWWIDAYSLGYLKGKYGVEANLDVADQYSTDGYQVWGQYWSTPFFPSKLNALIPAQSEEQKLGIVTMQWATRDPLNGYGNGVFESTYSVQANDYLLHDLGTPYFEKLLNIYPQTTVGLENDFDFSKFGHEYQKQLEIILDLKNKGKLDVYNMAQFSVFYNRENKTISPDVLVTADDPLGGLGKVVWVMSPRYRAGLFFGKSGVVIRDLRFYNDSNKEECFEKACEQLKLAFSQNSSIDEGNYNSKWVIDESPASEINVKKAGENIEIKYKTQAGLEKNITFLPNDIKIDDKVYTIPVAVSNGLVTKKTNTGESLFESRINLTDLIKRLIPEKFKFIVLVLGFFVIPGLIFSENLFLSLPIGISLFTLSAFGLGYLGNINPIFKSNLWFLSLPISGLFFKKNFLTHIKNLKLRKFNFKLISIVCLILIGSTSWVLTTIKNGLIFNYGLGFWGPNGHDAIWHLSLISQIQKNLPPQNPIYSGYPLSNYHYFYDLLIAKSADLLGINVLDLVFRFFPIVIALLSGILIYKLVLKISNSYTASFWATFFLYFGGSFGWIVSYFRQGDFGGETMFWSQQSISTLLNPPFAISLVLLLAGLNIFYQVKEKFEYKSFFGLILLFGTLIEFKAYGGILILGSLFFISLEKTFKKDFKYLGLFVGTAILSALVFLPNNSGSESLIELMPLWLINTMITSQDRLNWFRMTITLQSGVLYKLIYAYSVGVIVFLLGNFGSRLIGVMSPKEIFKERILSYILIFSIVLPLIFIQKGNGWNIIQFFYYGLFIMAIFTGIAIKKLFRILPGFGKIIISIILVGLTIPTTLNTLTQYLPQRPPSKLSLKEFEALNFLKNEPDGIVLSYPFDEKLRNDFSTPLPLSVYTSTSYVSAFSGKSGFIEDTLNLEILGIDYKPRLNLAREIFKNQGKAKELLVQSNINYVYLYKPLKLEIDENKMGLKTIYENEEAKVLRVIN